MKSLALSLFSVIALAAPAANAGSPGVSLIEKFKAIQMPDTPLDISKRDSWGVEYCNAINFSSNEGCRKDYIAAYTCYNFTNGWINSISSLRVDKGVVCSFYLGANCQGGALVGIRNNSPQSDLRVYTNANDNMESVMCWETGC